MYKLLLAILVSIFCLPAFSAVKPLVISWQVPALSADCTALNSNDVAGYRIYRINMMTGKIYRNDVTGGTQTSLIIAIDDATWYLFYMTAINTKGLISKPSPVIFVKNMQKSVMLTTEEPC